MKEEIFASRETRREDIVRLIASAHPDFKTLATAISTRMQLTRHVSVRGGKRRLFEPLGHSGLWRLRAVS